MPSKSVPKIDFLKLPKYDRKDAYQCQSNLQAIEGYCQDFARALQLYHFSGAQSLMWVSSPHHGMHDMFASWKFIAARDGAMSIYHFAKSMDGANTWAFRCESTKEKIDRSALGRAFALLRTHFPRFEAMRHAIAHAGEIAKNPKWLADHSFNGSYDSNMIKLENSTGTAIKNGLMNNIYIATFNNEIQEYEISQRTLEFTS